VTGRALVAGAVAAAILLVAGYVALGGGDYEPRRVADACRERPWRDAGVTEGLVQATLAAAACDLGVSRERLVLAFAEDDGLKELARERGMTDDELDSALRTAMGKAVDEGQRAGAIGVLEGFALLAAIAVVPVDRLLQAVRDRAG
jgi:hypothetical protein